MSNDYWIALEQTDNLQTNTATICYHRLIAEGRKKGDGGADDLRSQWAKANTQVGLEVPHSTFWNWIAQPVFDLVDLPPYSFQLQFTFTLAKPYLSKDDNAFYIIDNPIARDKVFQLPIVRPTGWKGSLCAALWQLGHKKAAPDEQIQRLFGDIRGNESGQAGRARFYPTFFTQTGLEIINPHDREKRAGKNPLLFESVPTGATGTFTLLYVPFDLIGKPETTTRAQIAEDVQLLAQGVQALFRTYGFGAKTSSGFGLAEEKVAGAWFFRSLEVPPPDTQAEHTASQQALPRYLAAPNRLQPEFLNPDGTFHVRSEQELKALKKAERQLYDKAKSWWEREGQAQTAPEMPPEVEVPPVSAWDFTSFAELLDQAGCVADALNKGGAE